MGTQLRPFLLIAKDAAELIVYYLYAATEEAAINKFKKIANEEGWEPFESIEVKPLYAEGSVRASLVGVYRTPFK